MAICGHQFHGGDASDWILSTSVSCLDGSTTASRILQELFKKHCRNTAQKTSRKRLKMMTISENPPPTKSIPETNRTSSFKEENEDLIVKKINGLCSLEDFDESQHLNGCPMKWLYKKKLLERNKMYKIERLCKTVVKSKEVKKEKCQNLRDKTPVEVKIHKINLTEKYTSNNDDTYMSVSSKKFEKDFESHRKKLAAKLNWKLHDESQDEGSFETLSELRQNYLPPRPLLGLKPLLSVLLAPQQDNRCCSLVAMQDLSPRKKKVKASLSIQSLDLLISPRGTKTRPKTTNAPRWGSKSSPPKKLQIPGHISMKLDPKPRVVNSVNELKVVYYNPPAKKLNDRTKQPKSLTSLFYELKGKTNYAYQNDQYFDELIKDLTMDEGQFKIKRFLNMSSMDLGGKSTKVVEAVTAVDGELNLVCEKVRFFDKKAQG